MEYVISSIDELNQLTKELLGKGYKKFLLEGDLWAWKTEFTKQLAQNLWIQNISSPTYTYINNYQNKLLHWDFYRINSEIEFINLWILDEIEDAEYVCIEWPKFTHLYTDSNWLKVKIQKLPSGKRKITIQKAEDF